MTDVPEPCNPRMGGTGCEPRRKGLGGTLALAFALALALALALAAQGAGFAAPEGPEAASGQTVRDLMGRGAGGEGAETDFESASSPAALWRLGAGVAVVLGLVIGALALYRRWRPAGRSAAGAGGVQVLGRTGLSPRHWVVVLRVGHRVVVVGISGETMTTLTEIDDEERGGSDGAVPEAPRDSTGSRRGVDGRGSFPRGERPPERPRARQTHPFGRVRAGSSRGAREREPTRSG